MLVWLGVIHCGGQATKTDSEIQKDKEYGLGARLSWNPALGHWVTVSSGLSLELPTWIGNFPVRVRAG